jgi:hypothetical protein
MIEPVIGKEASREIVETGNKMNFAFRMIDGGKPRLLLRPHGRSEGKVKRRAPTEYSWPFTWASPGLIHATRAHAAKMANENFINSWNRMIRNPEL